MKLVWLAGSQQSSYSSTTKNTQLRLATTVKHAHFTLLALVHCTANMFCSACGDRAYIVLSPTIYNISIHRVSQFVRLNNTLVFFLSGGNCEQHTTRPRNAGVSPPRSPTHIIYNQEDVRHGSVVFLACMRVVGVVLFRWSNLLSSNSCAQHLSMRAHILPETKG